MGNSTSNIILLIHTEKDNYFSGDIVQGNVKVKVKVSEGKNNHSNILNRIKNLHLVLIGGEISDDSDDRVEHVFLQKHFLLDKLDLQLHEGEYEYPFSFKLPAGLPSSFEIHRYLSFCKIEYVLRPVIVLQNEKGGKEEDIMLYDHENVKYKNKKRLNIKAVHDMMNSELSTPVIPEPTRFSTNICCCFNKGQVILAGSTARNKYTVGDKLEVAYSIDDQTMKQSLSCLSVILVQNISWHGHHKQHTTCQINMACGGKIDLDLDYCDNDVSHNKKMNEFTYKINNCVNFHIREPNSYSSGGMILQPYVGKYIEVSHYVEVRVKAGFWLSDIVLKIPVFIVPLKEASDDCSEQTFVESDSFSTDDDNTVDISDWCRE